MTARDPTPGTSAVGAVIIGAGHAGLAMSHRLTLLGIDHVVLERGRIAERWRSERWDSLHLLTPNWMSRLPGQGCTGKEPDGYLTRAEWVGHIEGYARLIGAPVRCGTAVHAVEPAAGGYRVLTSDGQWRCRSVVLASGAFARPNLPPLADALPPGVRQLTAREYRNPQQLADGGVLVVGASATGVQLALELQRSGRQVTLAVGEHVRMPRRYRGHDIQWWMHAIGLLDERFDAVDDLDRARRLPSAQLAGGASPRDVDLNALTAAGVRLVGRLAGVRDGTVQFSGSLHHHCKAADLKMGRLLRAVDDWVEQAGMQGAAPAAEPPEPTRVPASPLLGLDLQRGEIATVLWATGFAPDYGWLKLPVFDGRGRLRHEGGAVAAPGVYALGLPFMRRRKSSFIHGAADDTRELAAQLRAHLDASAPRVRAPCPPRQLAASPG